MTHTVLLWNLKIWKADEKLHYLYYLYAVDQLTGCQFHSDSFFQTPFSFFAFSVRKCIVLNFLTLRLKKTSSAFWTLANKFQSGYNSYNIVYDNILTISQIIIVRLLVKNCSFFTLWPVGIWEKYGILCVWTFLLWLMRFGIS